jgi:hypothetical protein
MPQLIPAPTRIPVPGGKVIDEHVGAVNTPHTALSQLAGLRPPGGAPR